MKNKLDIVSFAEAKQHRRAVELAPVTLYLTPEVVEAIAATVGLRPPETGAKLFGPREREGADVLEFDVKGSAEAGQAVYSPDTEWGDRRIAHWLLKPDGEQRVWTGDVHSHPGGYGSPSAEVGEGQGDLGYARAVLEAVEWMHHFFFPIVTNPGSGVPRLWPWVMLRERPGVALYASVEIMERSHFPPRQFAAGWLKAVGGETPIVDSRGLTVAMLLDLAEVAELLGCQVTVLERGYLFERDGECAFIKLPSDFPRRGPSVELVRPEGRLPFAVRWRRAHHQRVELRLKRLIDHALQCAKREF